MAALGYTLCRVYSCRESRWWKLPARRCCFNGKRAFANGELETFKNCEETSKPAVSGRLLASELYVEEVSTRMITSTTLYTPLSKLGVASLNIGDSGPTILMFRYVQRLCARFEAALGQS